MNQTNGLYYSPLNYASYGISEFTFTSKRAIFAFELLHNEQKIIGEVMMRSSYKILSPLGLLFVITLFLLYILLTSPALKPRQYVYTATYCKQEGCPDGGEEIPWNDYIHEGEQIGCPSVVEVLVEVVPAYRSAVPITADYYFKRGTCEVIPYEDSRNPRIMPPDKTPTVTSAPS